MNTECILA